MFISALVSHCGLSKRAARKVVVYMYFSCSEQQARQRTDVCRKRNKRTEETVGEEKKEMGAGGREREAFSLWVGYLPFPNKVGCVCFKLSQYFQAPPASPAPSKEGSHHLLLRCFWHTASVAGTLLLFLSVGKLNQLYTWGIAEKLFCLFSSQTHGLFFLPPFVSGR